MAIESFESFDEMWQYLQEEKEIAYAQVQPWQTEVRAGDYFQKTCSQEFLIFGIVFSEDEPRAEGLENYRFSKCYSIACVDGELGDIHVSTIERLLTEGEFLDAHRRGWRSP